MEGREQGRGREGREGLVSTTLWNKVGPMIEILQLLSVLPSIIGCPSLTSFPGRLPHRHKIVIAGNHEMTFDKNILPMTGEVSGHRRMKQSLLLKNRDELTSRGLTHMSQLLTNCIYLQDSMTTVHGLRIYGSPW